MTAIEEASSTRRSAGLFPLSKRGLLRVSGSDRRSWLNGMISNDVSSLEPGDDRSGCAALVLTQKGRVVADVHVLAVEDCIWLETTRTAVPDLKARLERYIIADDVVLEDVSDRFDRLALEGPASAEVFATASGHECKLAPACCGMFSIAGTDGVVAAFGWSGETAFQLFVPAGRGEAVAAALLEAAGSRLTRGCREALQILRIEAGLPALGAELSEDVLPGEARLEGAISDSKGCYIGQEIVARIRSRGRVNHLLVGLRFEAEAPPATATELARDGRRVGRVTSVCVSPLAGVIGLGFVRREYAEPGEALAAGGVCAKVQALPFVPPARQTGEGG